MIADYVRRRAARGAGFLERHLRTVNRATHGLFRPHPPASRPGIKSSAAGGSGSESRKNLGFFATRHLGKGHGLLFPQPAREPARDTVRRQLAAVLMICGAILGMESGCNGEKFPRYRVSGKATWEGRPIPAGLIYFEPDFSRGNEGPAGSAEIRDGLYDTAVSGKGVIRGPHRVRIDGFDPSSSKSNDGIVQNTPLFETYETTVEMAGVAAVHDFVVPSKTKTSSSLR